MKRSLFLMSVAILCICACKKEANNTKHEKTVVYTTLETFRSTGIVSYEILPSQTGKVSISNIEYLDKGTLHPTAEISIEPTISQMNYISRNGTDKFLIVENLINKSLSYQRNDVKIDLTKIDETSRINPKEKSALAHVLILINDYKQIGHNTSRENRKLNRQQQSSQVAASYCHSQTFINIGNSQEQVALYQTLEMTAWSNEHIGQYDYVTHTCGSNCLWGSLTCISICTVYYAC